jgi:hypothetical protein
LGLGPAIRQLPATFAPAHPPQEASDIFVFCPGCLVVGAPSYERDPAAADRLARDPAFHDWMLIVVSDEPARAARSSANFLWTTFTRFDPARDVHASAVSLVHHHAAFRPPVVIDARMKPGYPSEVTCDPETAALVTRRWKEYFPSGGVEMGDSQRAHLD